MGEDQVKSGVINDSMFELPFFSEDGIYALGLTAVDVAGNESVRNVNTYARLIEQDVLAYIMDSNVENKTGLYSFQYEDGTPISMRPDSFSDLHIMVMAKEETDVDIVLRDTNAVEKYVNTQVTADDSVYGVTIYNFVVKADFFQENFHGDTDADMYLTVKNEDKRIDLGKIHIDNMAPTCDVPEDFNSWHWYFGEEARVITLSNINELLDKDKCKVYDRGKEIEFTYSEQDSTLSFRLDKGWHNVGILLCDIAGNENIIQERVNIYVGYFWMWCITSVIVVLTGAAALTVVWHKKKQRALENA